MTNITNNTIITITTIGSQRHRERVWSYDIPAGKYVNISHDDQCDSSEIPANFWEIPVDEQLYYCCKWDAEACGGQVTWAVADDA